MSVISFLIQLAGATMLLLYAVRMVRTGIERAFGASFRRIVTKTTNPLSGAATGLVLAVILQSSAAVGLLVAGFAGAGTLSFAAGLPVVLGADLGSALLIQVLSFRLDWLVPLLLAIGAGFFIKSERRQLRQAGRIILGIAFILISLRFLRETMDPIRDSGFLPAMAAYLERDFIGAFVAGAALAFVMHSSVAVILMCVTVVAIGAIPVAAGVSLVLGANLGSALIPIHLSRGMPPLARRIPMANLIIRGTAALLAVVAVAKLPVLPLFSALGPAQTLITLHILFNLLLLLTLPFVRFLEPSMARLFPDTARLDTENPAFRSVLDDAAFANPALALPNLRRELLRMMQIVESMFAPTMELYSTFDKPRMQSIRGWDSHVNTALDCIRRFVSSFPDQKLSKQDRKLAREMAEYAIALETAGDIVVRRFLALAQEKAELGIKLSDEGQAELVSMHEQVLSNIALASNVLVSDDMESARLLLEEKAEMTRRERSSRKKHLKRLGNGLAISFDSSDLHLETLRALKEFNSQIAAVAYPILFRGGQLLESRLIDAIDERN